MTDEDGNEDGDYACLDYRNINRIQLGNFEFDTWFGNSVVFTPNEPDILGYKLNGKPTTSSKKYLEYNESKKIWINKLHFCPTCFKYSDKEEEISAHCINCPYKKKLPGKIMYHDGEYCIRKVRGSRHKLFCQCLCILAKFFLDSKSIFFNLNYYDFYIIYKTLDGILTPMGFYSRELLSWESNNLSCIVVIPCYQKQQLGTKLIDFSYHLSNYEQIISGPERPLSPFGKITYLNFWSKALARQFVYGELASYVHITLEIISFKTGFRVDDIVLALDYMKVLYEKGEKNIYTNYYSSDFQSDDEFLYLEDDSYSICLSKTKIKRWVIDHEITHGNVLDPDCLILY